MIVSGIFFTLAMNMYVTANGSIVSYKKSHEIYFDYNVKKAVADKMLRENSGECSPEGYFHFTGDTADSLNAAFPFHEPECKLINRKRILVYHLGKSDSASSELESYSGFSGL